MIVTCSGPRNRLNRCCMGLLPPVHHLFTCSNGWHGTELNACLKEPPAPSKLPDGRVSSGTCFQEHSVSKQKHIQYFSFEPNQLIREGRGFHDDNDSLSLLQAMQPSGYRFIPSIHLPEENMCNCVGFVCRCYDLLVNGWCSRSCYLDLQQICNRWTAGWTGWPSPCRGAILGTWGAFSTIMGWPGFQSERHLSCCWGGPRLPCTPSADTFEGGILRERLVN